MSRKRKATPRPARGGSAAPAVRNRRRFPIVAAVLLACAGGGVLWWIRAGTPGTPAIGPGPRPPAGDPRETSASPFLNVRPAVQYAGDAACAACHDGLVKSYRRHPMGRSLAPVSQATAVERYGGDGHNPFEAAGLVYRVERRGDRTFHQEGTAGGGVAAAAEAAYAVGSGRRGRSYLIEHDGYLFQSPITWYPVEQTWGLSPGYDRVNQHFGRPITAGCLFCHCNQAEPAGDAANRFRAPLFRGHAIGCERCHGPGEAHVEARGRGEAPAGPVDYTIVNPRHLEPGLRDEVCQQCHLQAEARVLPRGRAYFEYRPGLPLHLFVADFVRPADRRPENKFLGTVEQMTASRCYERSTGPNKLGCVSCHDPHALPAPEGRVAFYRDRCLKCHADAGCSLPRPERLAKSPEDNCVLCHMESRPTSIPHVATTDHTIPRRPGAKGGPAADWPRPDAAPLVPFPRELADPRDPDQSRNLGLALVEAARAQPRAVGRQLLEAARPLLDAAVADDPSDVPAWEAQAQALMLLGEPGSAEAAAAALREAPRRETALFLGAGLAMQSGRPAEAVSLAERAAEVNPWMWQYRAMLAEARAQGGDWPGAAAAAREALRLEPVNLPARQLQVRCYLRLGDRSRARDEFNACLGLIPEAQRPGFRQWFESELRQGTK
jgi:tetratricopeptide (TPR) repeat protein